jgi:DNA ligase-1
MTFPPAFRPLLAFKVDDPGDLRYPVLASPKFDGIRCVWWSGCAYSRTLKPIRNRFIQSQLASIFSGFDANGLDGELMVEGSFQDVTSGIMSEDGEPNFTYHIFDRYTLGRRLGFAARSHEADEIIAQASNVVATRTKMRIKYVQQSLISDPQTLLNYETEQLQLGHEGIMVRSIDGEYKFGRSTAREGILGKVKRFCSSEATIVGFECLLRNHNNAELDNLGLTHRSHLMENKRSTELLGALIVEDIKTNKRFRIGSGFTEAQRRQLWQKRPSMRGLVVKYKYLAHGMLDLPRHPVFLGFRDKDDM